MPDRNRRILWLLNHKTLMKFEISILQSIGFEVYAPKVIPNNVVDFRSGSIDYSADLYLSIPRHVINTLNTFNFYSQTWTDEITSIINHYFGLVFTMPLRFPLREVFNHFNGQIILRAFGFRRNYTYGYELHEILGKDTFNQLDKVRNRFWFGQGYQQLQEIEQPYFKNRSIYLPIGLDQNYWTYQNTWTGKDKQILFVCPNINDNLYYHNLYKEFKNNFGHFPHYIVGQQKNPVHDPHVLGNIRDEELISLYQSSTVLYYHSKDSRHLHYTPIEAAVIGTPIVLYQGNLLTRLMNKFIRGSVSDTKEAQTVITQLLSNDLELLKEIKSDQQEIPYYFSYSYCEPFWRSSMLAGPLGAVINQIEEESYVLLQNSDGQHQPEFTSPLQSYEQIKWFESIWINGSLTPGTASYESLMNRAQLFYASLQPGDTVLDIGGGDGFYSFQSELLGASQTHLLLHGNYNGFLFAKQALDSKVVLISNRYLEMAKSLGTQYDLVLVRDILNQIRNPLLLLDQLAPICKKRLVIETIVDLQNINRPALAYYGGEYPGYPNDGFGFNTSFLITALSKIGFSKFWKTPTPDAPNSRIIFIADK